MVWAIDVAKVEQYGVLMDRDRQVVVTVKWGHPAETSALLQQLGALPCRGLTAVMEPTGVYGDTLRAQRRQAGLEIHQHTGRMLTGDPPHGVSDRAARQRTALRL